MKIFTTGNSGHVSPPVAAELGLTGIQNQAEVLVTARSKAEAFHTLAQYDLAPDTVRDPEFRVAQGNVLDALIAADETTSGLFPAGAVLVVHQINPVTPVLRLHTATTFTVIGHVQRDGARLEFVAAEGVDVTHPVPPPDRTALNRVSPLALRTQLALTSGRIKALEEQLAEARKQRNADCHLAVQIGAVAEAAAGLNVSPGRIYQLADEALVDDVHARRDAVKSQ